jgi:hypothetical protein
MVAERLPIYVESFFKTVVILHNKSGKPLMEQGGVIRMCFLMKIAIFLLLLSAIILPISASGDMSESGPDSGGCYSDPITGEITCVDASGAPESDTTPSGSEEGASLGPGKIVIRSSYTPISTSPMSTIPNSARINTQDPNYQQLINDQNKLKEIANDLEAQAQRETDSDRRAYLYATKYLIWSAEELLVHFFEEHITGYYEAHPQPPSPFD